MKINFVKGKKYLIKVKVNSSKSEIVFIDNEIIVYVKSQPIDNKANLEIIKLFKNRLNVNIKIKSGLSSNKKLIEVL